MQLHILDFLRNIICFLRKIHEINVQYYNIKIFVVNITNAVNDSVDKPKTKFKPMSKKIKKTLNPLKST